MRIPRPEFLAGLLGLAVVLAIFFAFAAAGWPGFLEDCVSGNCYCERVHDGWFKQPANTWSNVGFMLVGLALLWILRSGPADPNAIAMRRPSFPATSYGATVIFLGPGSMFFHASLTRWGGLVDVGSMYLWVGWVLAWQIVRLADWKPWWAMALVWAGIAGGAETLTALVHGIGTICFAVLTAATGCVEVAICIWKPRGIVRDWRWLVAVLATFGVALGIWALSGGGLGDHPAHRGPWCDPDTWFQGHAVWHLLCAVATALLAVYLRGEKSAAAG